MSNYQFPIIKGKIISFLVFIENCRLTIANFAMVFFLASAEDGHISVKSHAANVVDKADVRPSGYLHGTCLPAKLQNDRADLGTTRRTDGVAFGEEAAIDVYGDFSVSIRRLLTNELFSFAMRAQIRGPHMP